MHFLSLIDNRTLAMVSVLLTWLFFLALIVQIRLHEASDGQTYWLAGQGGLSLGLSLLALQGAVSPIISVYLANTLVILSLFLFSAGLHRMVGRPFGRWPFFLLAFPAWLIFVFLNLTIPDGNFRVGILSIYFFLVSAEGAVAIFRNTQASLRVPFWAAGFLAITVAAGFGFRAASAFHDTAGSTVLLSNQPSAVFGMLTLLYGLVGWFIILMIISSSRMAYESELRNEDNLNLVFESSNEGLWSIDFRTGQRFYSEKWVTIVGHEIILDDPQAWREIVHPDDFDALLTALRDHLAGRTPHFSFEYRVVKTDGTYRWLQARGKALFDAKGSLVKMAGSHQDISEKKAREETIQFMARHDSLTGLYNRYYLRNELDSLLAAEAENLSGLFIFIDLDNFKVINDTYGHPIGDQLLIQLGERLETYRVPNSILSRLGGDEFTIFLYDREKTLNAAEILPGIMTLFNEPFHVEEHTFSISASVGVAMVPDHGRDFDTLLKYADAAMYEAKELGKNQYNLYHPGMTQQSLEKARLDQMLRMAVVNKEFVPYYQPVVSKHGHVWGFEALIRWNGADGLMLPGLFIPRAEENGLIVPIGTWILEESCQFAAKLPETVHISVNLSARQIQEDDFVKTVLDILERTGLSPGRLQLEITETALMRSFQSNRKKLQQLRDFGVKVALDDFGTGYSSLNYIKLLPITSVKVDRSFVAQLNQSMDRNILEGIVGLAHTLGITVVAEGVETVPQNEIVANMNIDYVQGFYYSRPIPADAAENYVVWAE
ncbi:MAG: putative bifunctional diguanylate cyclase/phosphodiesterase [Solirubrobacterales bacterium]